MTTDNLPEIKIPFLTGAEPWPVFDATELSGIESIDLRKRQLISWLTLPLAAEIVTSAIVVPLEAEIYEGDDLFSRTYFHKELLDRQIAQQQKKTQTGSASPPFIHIALDPEQPEQLNLLVPTAQQRRKHLCFQLGAKISTISSKAEASTTRTVIVLPKLDRAINRLSTDKRLEVPGIAAEARAEPGSALPIKQTIGQKAAHISRRIEGWQS